MGHTVATRKLGLGNLPRLKVGNGICAFILKMRHAIATSPPWFRDSLLA